MVQRVRGRNDSDSSKCVAPDFRRPAIGVHSSFNSIPEIASSALIASYGVGAFSMAGWMLVFTKYL